jgi:hypothetical protein
MEIKKAERQKVKIRMGLSGPAGSGKSYSALQIAYGICGDWSKICVIDTESGRANLYANMGEYSTIEITGDFSPQKYEQAFDLAEKAGMKVIIVDSLSHAWIAKGGLLDMVDKITAANPKAGLNAWGQITPIQQKFQQRMLESPCHVIFTVRSKTEVTYINGKVTKLGMKMEYRDGIEYEFTIHGEMNEGFTTITKDVTGLFAENKTFQPTIETGAAIAEWCGRGVDKPQPKPVENMEAENKDRARLIRAIKLLYTSFGFTSLWEKTDAVIDSFSNDRVLAAYEHAVKSSVQALENVPGQEALFFAEKLPEAIQKAPFIVEVLKKKANEG